jgi:hypothetical protein
VLRIFLLKIPVDTLTVIDLIPLTVLPRACIMCRDACLLRKWMIEPYGVAAFVAIVIAVT